MNIGNQIKNFISGNTSSSSLIDCAGQIARISNLARNFSCRESAQFATLACAPAYVYAVYTRTESTVLVIDFMQLPK